jgi:hypothetical protein
LCVVAFQPEQAECQDYDNSNLLLFIHLENKERIKREKSLAAVQEICCGDTAKVSHKEQLEKSNTPSLGNCEKMEQ